MLVSGRKTIYTIKEMFKKSVMVLFVIFFSLPSRVSSERNVSRKNAKVFGSIFSRKCENCVKTMNFIAATINCTQKNLWISLL